MNKILFISLFSFLIMGSLNAWYIMPNQYEYFNITNINWTTSFNGNNGIKTSYIFVNLTQYNISTPITWLLVSGYNTSGSWVGNITFWPFHNGILIPNTTLSNNQYNTLSIWYKPTSVFTPYFDKEKAALSNITSISNQYNNYFNIYLYGAQITKSQTSFIGSSYASVSEINFNIRGLNTYGFNPYLLLSNNQGFIVHSINGNILVNPNVSLTYTPIPVSGSLATSKYTFNQTGLETSITSTDTFYSASLSGLESSNSSNLLFCAYCNKYFISNDLYIYSNGTIINSTTSGSSIGGIFPSTTQYQLRIYAPNTTINFAAPPQTYYILPAYSTNFITTNGIIISTPNSTIELPLWEWQWNFTNINWTMPYSTLANVTSKITYISNVGYLLLNITHYTNMGDCSNIQALPYGQPYNETVPFAIYSCNSQRLVLLLKNTTSLGHTYNNLTIFFQNPYGISGFNNQTILSNFQNNYTAGTYSLPNVTNYLVTFKNYLNVNDIIQNPAYYTGTDMFGAFGTASAIPYMQAGFVGYKVSAGYYDKQFLVSGSHITSAHAIIHGDCTYIANMTDKISFTSYCNLFPTGDYDISVSIGNSAIGQLPFTTNYILGAPESIAVLPNCIGSTCNINSTLVDIPKGGFSPLVTWLNSSLINRSNLLVTSGLNQTQNIYGNQTDVASILIIIIFILVAVFGVFVDNYIAIVIGLAIMWIVIIGTAFDLIWLGILATVIIAVAEILDKKFS